MHPRLWYRTVVCASALAIAATFAAYAYDLPLSPEDIREAYFLGRQPGQADAFLSRYTQSLSSSSGQLIISRVQLLTPYARIVTRSRFDMTNQNSVDASQAFAGRSLPLIVRVWFDLPIAYGGPIDKFDDLVRRSAISVSQDRRVKPRATSYTPLYSVGKGHWRNGLEVQLTFDARQLHSGPVRIAILSPNGQHAEASFDLSSLK